MLPMFIGRCINACIHDLEQILLFKSSYASIVIITILPYVNICLTLDSKSLALNWRHFFLSASTTCRVLMTQVKNCHISKPSTGLKYVSLR